METIFLCIVLLLCVLAVFDLMVGVSNDAVNFLNSAVGAKAASLRTIMIIASAGVLVGAVLSNGMMDIARHGILTPMNYSFYEVMIVFLAVMVTDVVLLDVFNTLGMPTSTTVSMVFELLGGAFLVATFKSLRDDNLTYGDLLNTDKALEVILGIFLSVAIAFVVGTLAQWLARTIFTFNYRKHLRWTIALFGGISITALCYFMFIKGVKNTPLVSDATKGWIDNNTGMLVTLTFIATTILTEVLYLARVNVFRIIILVGTFSLAMAFAGNDLVNFIGVTLTSVDSYQDFIANGSGDPHSFMMTSLMSSAKTPVYYLLAAAAIMIFAMTTSKKARNVIKTSVDLSRQDESDEMFGSSRVARSLVRFCASNAETVSAHTPRSLKRWINSRFDTAEAVIVEGAAFDEVRAAINLVVAGMLIILGTNMKLPLSTTYVTFMVAMGTSLADRAWGRESAVFRVTGVLSVIGGWFITAGAAFVACALVTLLMYTLGYPAMIVMVVVAVTLLIRSNIRYKKKEQQEAKTENLGTMLRKRSPEMVWEMLCGMFSKTQTYTSRFTKLRYKEIINGMNSNNVHTLRRVRKELRKEQDELKKFRRRELICLSHAPEQVALERNTWFHLASNADQQYIYCLRRMLDPILEHVDNGFPAMPDTYKQEYESVQRTILDLMGDTEDMINTGHYDRYERVQNEADNCKDRLSVLRKRLLDRMQQMPKADSLQASLVYLNTLQESQELLSIMRHQLRASNKFTDLNPVDGIDDYE